MKGAKAKIDKIWEMINKEMFTCEAPYQFIEMSDKMGSNTFYSTNITHEEAKLISEAMVSGYISESGVDQLLT